MIRVLDSAGSTLVEWGRQQQHDDGDHDDGDNDDGDYDYGDFDYLCKTWHRLASIYKH